MRQKLTFTYFAALTVSLLVVVASCGTFRSAPDPARIEEELQKARLDELALVRSTIEPAQRAEEFIGLLVERDRLLERYAEQISGHREKLAALNADYSAQRADFDALLEEFNRNRAAAQIALIDLTGKMKQATTDDEWREIADFQTARLDLRQLAYRDRTGGT